MHVNLQEVLDGLEHAAADLRSAIESVPGDRRSLRPGLGRWSVAEVVQHLSRVEARIGSQLQELIVAAKAAGLGPEAGPRDVLSSQIATAMSDRTAPRTSPEPVAPAEGVVFEDAWSEFERAHRAFRETLVAADGLALGEVVTSHRLFGPLNAYQWVELMAGHERRHAEQIREIGKGEAG